MRDAFGVDRPDVVSKRREYKMKGVGMMPMVPAGGVPQNMELGEHEYVMRKTGQTLFRKRPKYEVGLYFPKYKGVVAPTRMKPQRYFGDQLHREYKPGTSKTIDGSKVTFG